MQQWASTMYPLLTSRIATDVSALDVPEEYQVSPFIFPPFGCSSPHFYLYFPPIFFPAFPLDFSFCFFSLLSILEPW